MDYEKLLPEKQSSGDERAGPSKPEQLKYHSVANCFDKLTFGWIFPLLKVPLPPRSSATSSTSSRTTSRTWPWRSSPNQSTACGCLTGWLRSASTRRTRSSSLSSRPSTVPLYPRRAVSLGFGAGLPGLPVHPADPAGYLLHLPDVGETALQLYQSRHLLHDHHAPHPLL